MNAGRILFPTDFSSVSDDVLTLAVSLARDRKAELIIAHVVEPGTVYCYGESRLFTTVGGASDPNYRELEHRLAAVVPDDTTVRFRHVLAQGIPAQEIVRLAEEENVDLIVIGTHGWTGLKHLLMGSVAEAVVRHATCPVMTVRGRQNSPVMVE